MTCAKVLWTDRIDQHAESEVLRGKVKERERWEEKVQDEIRCTGDERETLVCIRKTATRHKQGGGKRSDRNFIATT